MWDLPRPGLEPVSPALAGRFSTTAPPGKPQCYLFNLSGQHAPLDPQDGGDVDVLPGDGVQPCCETVHGRQKQDPGELQNIK